MKAESKYLNQPLEFWANVRLISQKDGYTERKTSKVKIPTHAQIEKIFKNENLDSSILIKDKIFTDYGTELIEYFEYRAYFLEQFVKPNLLNKEQARILYNEMLISIKPTSPQPMNKQSGDKKAPLYYTGMINMLIEANSGGYPCNYNPKVLTAFTKDKFPIRSMSRQIDGAFPNIVDPIAIWEIKEYYSTTTFGSRVADGVYETQLDGYELNEVRQSLNREINHYLMVDDYFTWWIKGRSYLCRICDLLHMGLLTEALFGKEIITRLPEIVKDWINTLEVHQL